MIQKVTDSRGLGIGYLVTSNEGCNAGMVVAVPAGIAYLFAPPQAPSKSETEPTNVSGYQSRSTVRVARDTYWDEATCPCCNYLSPAYRAGVISCVNCGQRMEVV